MDRRAWRATVHEVAKELDTTQLLNNNKAKNQETFVFLPQNVLLESC